MLKRSLLGVLIGAVLGGIYVLLPIGAPTRINPNIVGALDVTAGADLPATRSAPGIESSNPLSETREAESGSGSPAESSRTNAPSSQSVLATMGRSRFGEPIPISVPS